MTCFTVIHDNEWDALNFENGIITQKKNRRKENESSRIYSPMLCRFFDWNYCLLPGITLSLLIVLLVHITL